MITFLVLVVICFAYFVQAAFAFGGPMIAAPILSLIIDPKDAVVMTTIFSILGSALILNLWRHIDWGKMYWLLPNLVVGLLAGFMLFRFIYERVLLLLLASYIVAHVLTNLWKPWAMANVKWMMPMKFRAVAGGFSGGFIQGATGVGGGPPIVAYLKSSCGTVDEYRATYMVTWLMGNLIRLSFMGYGDFVHDRIVYRSLIILPFFAVALYAGYYLPRGFNKTTFNNVVDLLLLVTAGSIFMKCLL
jgi:uncharacterized protein